MLLVLLISCCWRTLMPIIMSYFNEYYLPYLMVTSNSDFQSSYVGVFCLYWYEFLKELCLWQREIVWAWIQVQWKFWVTMCGSIFWRCIRGWRLLVNLFNCILLMSFVSRCAILASSYGSFPINYSSYLWQEYMPYRRLHLIYMTFLRYQAGGTHIIAQFHIKWPVQEDISASR